MEIILEDERQRVPVHNYASFLEDSARQQAINLARHERVFHHVALMPDAHKGEGATIGSVFGTSGCVIPSAVGVDIGCGMCAYETGLPIDKAMIDNVANAACRVIPVGFSAHATPQEWSGFEYASLYDELTAEIQAESPYKLGTLGGGNHFIEFQRGPEDKLWVMIHSGSRNIGLKIANHYIRLAKDLNPNEVDPALSHLDTDKEEGQSYLADMNWALSYAYENRRRMMIKTLGILSNLAERAKLSFIFDESKIINIHHNYAKVETHFGQEVVMHRKGATLASKETVGLIPGSMGTCSYVVKGLGNPDSFQSCSHGAGRVMGRKQAQRTLSKEDVNKAMKGITVKAPGDYTDEAPQAYKNIDQVMEDQKDLVEILVKLIPLAVVKG